MKLKVAAIAGAVFACGLHGEVDQALNRAVTDGAQAKLILRVVDQDGNPVPDARVRCGFWRNYSGGGPLGFDLTTERNGICTAKGKCTRQVAWTVMKNGYYNSSGEWKLSETEAKPKVSGGKWQPYGSTRTIVLKKIKNPDKLRIFPDGKRMCRWKIPALDRWIGFDLEVFDWVEPAGIGRHDDVLIRFKSEIKNKYFDFRFDMDISFTNNLYAGVYERKKDKFSMFEWEYHANTNNVFKDSLSFWCEKRPGKRGETKGLAEDSYLVFRTRTKVDEDGRLKEAHYGVISGEWISGSETMRISDACFNPFPNDTNIEDGYYLRKKVQWSKDSTR